tara:strand:+ start:201 stop:1145 length:945 start_codon:yes stop_codon:yes gene_type:complete
MKLKLSDIKNKHKGAPCVVAAHGPSLNSVKSEIESLQSKDKMLRISVNEWFDFFKQSPDYWVVSNSEFTIGASMVDDPLWNARGYPRNVFNNYNIPLFFNSTADLTAAAFVENNLHCDYLPYDTRHFKLNTCFEILKNFQEYYRENKNLDFKYYGNNSTMWQRPDISEVNPYCARVHGKIAAGWSHDGKCCERIDDSQPTLQEYLQEASGHERHMSPGHTVTMFAIMFAVLMGCNPVYITGMDLDYKSGYAENAKSSTYTPNIGNVGHWKHVYRKFLLDDMRILKESADFMGIKIINLNKNAWYDVFEFGDLPE